MFVKPEISIKPIRICIAPKLSIIEPACALEKKSGNFIKPIPPIKIKIAPEANSIEDMLLIILIVILLRRI